MRIGSSYKLSFMGESVVLLSQARGWFLILLWVTLFESEICFLSDDFKNVAIIRYLFNIRIRCLYTIWDSVITL